MRQGDEATDRLLRERFRRDSAAFAAPAEPCPDAEMLAAYVDRTLSTAEAQAVEAHAASCGPCTQMMAMLVDSDPEAAADAVPEDDRAPAAAPARAPRTEPRASASWWRWGFAIPALAAVLVLGVWLSSMLPGGRSPDVTDVMARNEPAERAAKAAEAAPQVTPQSSPSLPAESSAASARQEPAAPPVAPAPPARRDEARDALERQVKVAPPPSADDRLADSSSPPAQLASPPPAPETFAKAEDSGARAARAEDAVQGRAAAAQAQRGARNERQQEALAFTPAPLLLTSGNGRVQWRITGTTIARSNDGGSTWQADFEAPRPVTAGAIVADGTVWLGGRGGLVLRRAASGWTTVTAPAAADVVSVSDVSATAATVTLADGRRLRTEDGGRTWVAR